MRRRLQLRQTTSGPGSHRRPIYCMWLIVVSSTETGQPPQNSATALEAITKSRPTGAVTTHGGVEACILMSVRWDQECAATIESRYIPPYVPTYSPRASSVYIVKDSPHRQTFIETSGLDIFCRPCRECCIVCIISIFWLYNFMFCRWVMNSVA